MKSRLFSALPLLALGCSVLESPVARSVDGVVTEGRFIDPEAYALYAVGALHEARGEWAKALRLYQRAVDVDARGPEVRTRIGAMACKLGNEALAERSFEAAERAGSDYGPLWYERAVCHRARGALEPAQAAALRAVRLDPERPEASLLAADIAEQRRDTTLAWQLRDALGTHAPGSRLVWRSLRDAATRSGDAGRAARAEQRLEELGSPAGSVPAPRGLAAALDALERGDVKRAKEESRLLLGADPSSGDALVIALAAADLEGDAAGFEALLTSPDAPVRPASQQVLQTLRALLSRRVGQTAADVIRP